MHRERAYDFALGIAFFFKFDHFVGDFVKFRRIEEIGALQVCVAFFVLRIYRGGLDGGLERFEFFGVFVVVDHGVKFAEISADF